MCPETESSGPRAPPARALLPPETRRSPCGRCGTREALDCGSLGKPRRLMTSRRWAPPQAHRAGQRGEPGGGAGAAGVAWHPSADTVEGRDRCPLASTAPPVVGGVGRAGPRVPDRGAASVLCAGWRGSRQAGAACSRGGAQARGSGGYMRRRRASWPEPAGPHDGSGRPRGPAQRGQQGGGGARWRCDGSSGRHPPRRAPGRHRVAGRSPPTLGHTAGHAAGRRPPAFLRGEAPPGRARRRGSRGGPAPHRTSRAQCSAGPARATGSADPPRSRAPHAPRAPAAMRPWTWPGAPRG